LLFATRFAPDDLFQRVIAEFSRKSAPHAKFNAAREAKKSGAAKSWRSLICVNTSMATDQRPKNSHNRRITGIGTPSSQSRSPRPILASMKTLRIQERQREGQVPQSGKNLAAISVVRH